MKFTTSTLAAADRFEHWREMRCRALFGVTIEIERERRNDFHGEFSTVGVGGATLGELEASSYVVSRTERDIGQRASNSICIARQVRGPGWVDLGKDRVHAIAENALATGHTDLAYTATPARQDGFHFRMLTIPLPANDDLSRAANALVLEPLRPSLPVANLLTCVFDTVVDQGESLANARQVIRDIAQLALMARGRVGPGTPESRLALRGGYLLAARRLIAGNLHDAALTPDAVAAALGMSVRKLHMLFEPTGQSFARALSTARVAEAKRLLRAEPAKAVADIAFDCGFDSLATFYRSFRAAFGATPQDIRQAGRKAV